MTDSLRTGFDEFIGSPLIDDRVALAALIASDFDAACSSDLLHIIVADDNVEDHWFDLDQPDIRASYDVAEPWEQAIFDALAALSERERVTVVAMASGLLPIPD